MHISVSSPELIKTGINICISCGRSQACSPVGYLKWFFPALIAEGLGNVPQFTGLMSSLDADATQAGVIAPAL
jgi:hypothetical protein